MIPACDHCRFFHPLKGDPHAAEQKPSIQGECRRYPPQFGDVSIGKPDQLDVRLGVFPRVLTFHWCGEFAPHNPA